MAKIRRTIQLELTGQGLGVPCPVALSGSASFLAFRTHRELHTRNFQSLELECQMSTRSHTE